MSLIVSLRDPEATKRASIPVCACEEEELREIDHGVGGTRSSGMGSPRTWINHGNNGSTASELAYFVIFVIEGE